VPARLGRTTRILRTGLAFAVYFGGSLVMGAVVLPLLAWWHRADPARARDRAQRWIHSGYRVFVGVMRGQGLIRVRLKGGQRLRVPGPRLLVANHPTLVDSALLGTLLPQMDCVASESWADHPYLKRAVRAAGYLRNDGGAAVVDEAVQRLREGRTLLMFPEGTRSPDGGLGPFHRGFAHVALRSGVDPTPVVLTCRPNTLGKDRHWYDVPDRAMQIVIRVEEPVSVKDAVPEDESQVLAARTLTAALREHFSKRLEREAVSVPAAAPEVLT